MAEPSLFYWHLCSSKILITNEPRICFMLEFCPDYGSRCKLGYNCSRLDCFHLDTCHREQRLIIGVRSLNLSLECQMGVMTASGSYLLECLGQHHRHHQLRIKCELKVCNISQTSWSSQIGKDLRQLVSYQNVFCINNVAKMVNLAGCVGPGFRDKVNWISHFSGI